MQNRGHSSDYKASYILGHTERGVTKLRESKRETQLTSGAQEKRAFDLMKSEKVVKGNDAHA